MQRTVGLQDIVPTVCYLLDLPVPEHVEGGVIYQAFEDPNFKLREVQRLRESLGRLEAQLSGKDD